MYWSLQSTMLTNWQAGGLHGLGWTGLCCRLYKQCVLQENSNTALSRTTPTSTSQVLFVSH